MAQPAGGFPQGGGFQPAGAFQPPPPQPSGYPGAPMMNPVRNAFTFRLFFFSWNSLEQCGL